MPRFSEQEKQNIQQALLTEGERLFTSYGLKKVTIDDIVKAVNIAKATFYRFYEGKEYLFLDIAQRQQHEIFEILNDVLIKNESMSDLDRVKNIFFEMSRLMPQYPMLTGIDEETALLVARKVSPQRIEEYQRQGFDAVKTIEDHGIQFKYESEVVSKLFHLLYESWVKLQKEPVEMQKKLIDIMLEGIMGQIL